jgi:hypothetical protein
MNPVTTLKADIEKVVMDFLSISPVNGQSYSKGGFGGRLPGELPVVVGQNPRVASSIGATQHTQIASGDAAQWPLFALRGHPSVSHTLYELADDVHAYIEIVQVGQDEDSVMLRLELPQMVHARCPDVIELVHSVRNDLLLRYGALFFGLILLLSLEFDIYAISIN